MNHTHEETKASNKSQTTPFRHSNKFIPYIPLTIISRSAPRGTNLKLIRPLNFYQISNSNSPNFADRNLDSQNKTSHFRLPPIESSIVTSIKRSNYLTKPTSTLIIEAAMFIKYMPKVAYKVEELLHLIKPPGYENKKTLILDLDETLVHAEDNPINCHVCLKIPIKGQIGLNLRPYCFDLLKFASKEFEVIIFTASQKSYADAIIDHLDPLHLFVHHRLYREHCTANHEHYIKNIERIADRNIKDIIIVDNSIISFLFHLDNGVPISTWYSNINDFQLKLLIDYLKLMIPVNDIREVNRPSFQLQKLIVSAKITND
ncbi:hypothetical protein SteCoe_1222 [Stentor coeruleus]|uniref:FCP1 homology domain-containing protein n=1 Tax=Stentor coeruleus TaxID=5963 RepID=A0A1R2D2F7_9CILI|nr:hypothetical protein SteCoe_1222 [Stentor coeruleus]